MKKREIFIHRIPGAWYGNSPGSLTDPKEGSVCIDASRTYQAIKWLSRRAEIMGTWVSPDINPGLVINYRLR